MAEYTPTPEDQDLGGFELIPEGKYYAALDSPEEQLNEEQQKEREGQPDTNFPLGRIRVPFKVSRGDMRIAQYRCLLTSGSLKVSQTILQ